MSEMTDPHAKCHEETAALRRQADALIVQAAMLRHDAHYRSLVSWFESNSKPKSSAVHRFTFAIGEGSTVGRAMWKKYGGSDVE